MANINLLKELWRKPPTVAATRGMFTQMMTEISDWYITGRNWGDMSPLFIILLNESLGCQMYINNTYVYIYI